MSPQEPPEAEALDHEDKAAFKTKRMRQSHNCHHLLIQHRLYCQRYGGVSFEKAKQTTANFVSRLLQKRGNISESDQLPKSDVVTALIISEFLLKDSRDNSSIEDKSDSLSNKRIIPEIQIPDKVGVGPRSAFFSLKSFGRGAQRTQTAAKDLSTITNYNKVSHDMILLTYVSRMHSLNQVEQFGSGHFISDDSSLSASKGLNERKYVTFPKSNTDKFVSTPTTVISCKEDHDVSRQISNKADSFELSLKAFINAIFYPYVWDAFAYGGIELLVSSGDTALLYSTSDVFIAFGGLELLVSIHIHVITSRRVVFMFVDLNHLGTSGLRLALRDLGFGDRLDISPMWTHTNVLRLDIRDLGRGNSSSSVVEDVNIISRVKRHEVR